MLSRLDQGFVGHDDRCKTWVGIGLGAFLETS
jgi:hypothetical protein